MIAAGGIDAGWSGEPTGRRNVLGGLIWPRQAAVIGSGMSEEEEEEGVDTNTRAHQSERKPAYGKPTESNDAHLPALTINLLSSRIPRGFLSA